MCLEMCFVIEFTYLEAQLHMWKHLTFGLFATYFKHISPLRVPFTLPMEDLHIWRHDSSSCGHWNVLLRMLGVSRTFYLAIKRVTSTI
jgi:hypothetical protein